MWRLRGPISSRFLPFKPRVQPPPPALQSPKTNTLAPNLACPLPQHSAPLPISGTVSLRTHDGTWGDPFSSLQLTSVSFDPPAPSAELGLASCPASSQRLDLSLYPSPMSQPSRLPAPKPHVSAIPSPCTRDPPLSPIPPPVSAARHWVAPPGALAWDLGDPEFAASQSHVALGTPVNPSLLSYRTRGTYCPAYRTQRAQPGAWCLLPC